MGGNLFIDVRRPFVVDGNDLLTFHRSSTGELSLSFDLRDLSGNEIAEIRCNHVSLSSTASCTVHQAADRFTVTDLETKRIWCDIHLLPRGDAYELDISAILVSPSGYPIIIHPDRLIVGPGRSPGIPEFRDIHFTAESEEGGCFLGGGIGLGLLAVGLTLESFESFCQLETGL